MSETTAVDNDLLFEIWRRLDMAFVLAADNEAMSKRFAETRDKVGKVLPHE